MLYFFRLSVSYINMFRFFLWKKGFIPKLFSPPFHFKKPQTWWLVVFCFQCGCVSVCFVFLVFFSDFLRTFKDPPQDDHFERLIKSIRHHQFNQPIVKLSKRSTRKQRRNLNRPSKFIRIHQISSKIREKKYCKNAWNGASSENHESVEGGGNGPRCPPQEKVQASHWRQRQRW